MKRYIKDVNRDPHSPQVRVRLRVWVRVRLRFSVRVRVRVRANDRLFRYLAHFRV
jgi:hypothetical protein